MNDLDEKYPGEMLPEEQLIEVEPDKETADGIIPVIDLEQLAKLERAKWTTPPVAEA
jgi:hypothetical protein